MNSENVSIKDIVAVVVTYFPDEASIDNIKTLLKYFQKVVIVDNTPDNGLIDILNNDSVHIIKNYNNLGVAHALNQGIKIAKNMGAKWVITFDQDSRLLVNYPKVIMDYSNAQPNNDNKTSIIGCNYTNPDTGRSFFNDPNNLNKFNIVQEVITSGMAFTIDTYEKIGGFDSSFFIDFVDHDFCSQASVRGVQCLMTSSPLIQHSIGNQTAHRFFHKTIYASNHSAARRYYMARNFLYYRAKYKNTHSERVKFFLKVMIKDWIKIFLYEQQKYRKMKHIFRGFWDYNKGKRGRIDGLEV
tara:strand:- start:13751 stop:14647 length:897 start_codon:yes stop_codon:yes gene_type:complete